MKSKPSICESCSYHKQSIFGVLDSEMIARLDSYKKIYHYKAGQLIFSEGDPSFRVYHIYSGYVKLSKTGWDGEKLVIRLRGPGDIFGHRAVLSGEIYTAEAIAIVDTIVCIIPSELFLDAVKTSPDFAMRVLQRISNDLRASEEQTMSITHEDVSRRVARLLLYLIEYYEESRRKNLIIPNSLTRLEMAQMIGTTRESFSRALYKLDNKKLIKVTRTEIQIINLNGLRCILHSFDSNLNFK